MMQSLGQVVLDGKTVSPLIFRGFEEMSFLALATVFFAANLLLLLAWKSRGVQFGRLEFVWGMTMLSIVLATTVSQAPDGWRFKAAILALVVNVLGLIVYGFWVSQASLRRGH